MPSLIRKIAKKASVAINLFTAILFFLSCVAPYFNPESWWMLSILGIGFPILIAIQIGFVFWWLITKPKLVWLPLIVLLIGYKSIGVFIGVQFNEKSNSVKSSSSIRVVSWNVARFREWRRNSNKKSQVRLKMLQQLKEQNADVICLQEFFYSTDSNYYHNIKELKKMGYPYFYFSYDASKQQQYVGSAIFSRYPIVDSGKVRYFRPSVPEALIYVDLKIKNDTIRVFTTHLQSVQFQKKDYEAINEITKAEDSLFVHSKTILSKLKKAIKYRSTQADLVRKILDDSPFPKIMCGDLNDIPNSYTYFTIRGDMQDAFLKKGMGIGRTFNGLSPTLRIDYIFVEKSLAINQFRRVINNYSDHYMLSTDIQINNWE